MSQNIWVGVSGTGAEIVRQVLMYVRQRCGACSRHTSRISLRAMPTAWPLQQYEQVSFNSAQFFNYYTFSICYNYFTFS